MGLIPISPPPSAGVCIVRGECSRGRRGVGELYSENQCRPSVSPALCGLCVVPLDTSAGLVSSSSRPLRRLEVSTGPCSLFLLPFLVRMEGDATLYIHLRRIPTATTQEALASILQTLWNTRSTGVSPLQKPGLQSLLNLPSIQELDLVLACLRSIIRKTVHQELSVADVRKLFPVDLPVDLQDILSELLLRYQREWKEEASRDLHSRTLHQPTTNVPLALTPPLVSETSSSMWPQINDATSLPNKSSDSTYAMDSNPRSSTSVPAQKDIGSLDRLVDLPGLKSVSWTMENRNSAPANRVAIISLKLQDNTKSPAGEVEVKFQLSRDTLEAMLRSMTYISEKISDVVAAPEPSPKKQRQ